MIPEPLPLIERAICYNGGIKDGCGATVEFKDGVALCPKCEVYQRYVEADADFIASVTDRSQAKAKVVGFPSRG